MTIIVLISAIHHHGSAINIHMSSPTSHLPPYPTPPHPYKWSSLILLLPLEAGSDRSVLPLTWDLQNGFLRVCSVGLAFDLGGNKMGVCRALIQRAFLESHHPWTTGCRRACSLIARFVLRGPWISQEGSLARLPRVGSDHSPVNWNLWNRRCGG